MTQSVQQQHSVVRTLESLTVRLQKLTKLLAPTEDVPLKLLCSNDTSDLITQVENALVSIKVEQLGDVIDLFIKRQFTIKIVV
jgi:hypothetical protein